MNAPTFWTMPMIGKKVAGWDSMRIGAVKKRLLTRADFRAEIGSLDKARGTRSLVQALAEFEGVQLRREEAESAASESHAA